jgi:endo-1,4-beta-mannosidase
VVRWFWGSDGRAFFDVSTNGRGGIQGISESTLQRVDAVVATAEKLHVKLIPVLFDFRFVIGSNHVLYEGSAEIGGESHRSFLEDPDQRAMLVRDYVQRLVRRYRDSPAILYWEIMNEAGNAVRGPYPPARPGVTCKIRGGRKACPREFKGTSALRRSHRAIAT